MNILRRIADLYIDGFRNMRLGRQLWALIIIKLIIIFVILKIFFFPDYIKEKTSDGHNPAETVRQEILKR